jgi:hypothetical protein
MNAVELCPPLIVAFADGASSRSMRRRPAKSSGARLNLTRPAEHSQHCSGSLGEGRPTALPE